MRFRPLLSIQIVLSFLGAFIASAVSLSHYLGVDLACTMETGCSRVLTHPSSMWGPIPVAVFGLGAYLSLIAIFAMMAPAGEVRKKLWTVAAVVSGLGFGISMYLQYIAFGVIGSRCDWCLGSAATMTAIFIGTILMKPKLGDESDADVLRPMAISGVLLLAGIAMTTVTLQVSRNKSSIVIRGLEQYKVTDVVGEPDKYAIGPKDAKLTIVEFADIFCPGCRRSYTDFKALYNERLKDKVRLIYRHYPLTGKEGHEYSDLAAMACEYAAKQGKFHEVVDAFFAVEMEEVNSPQGIAKVLDDNGVSSTGFQKELAAGSTWLIDAVEDDKERATKAGVSATPTFLIFAEGLKPKSADQREIMLVWDSPEYAALLNK